MAVNLRGVFLCSRAAIPHMKEQRWGKIVNLGSSAGRNGGSISCAAYAVSKAGVMCFTKALATELAPYGVNVNAVAPALIQTDMIKDITHLSKMIPLGRLGTTNDVASVVAFLCSENASYLTGEIVDVNGGFLID
jgi:3-oxoacyl-[acyl-carrier protein] reductase